MNDSSFLLDAPSYWIVFTIALALAFSALLYYGVSQPWPSKINRSLALLRFFVIFFILTLLLDVFFSTVVRKKTPPSLAIVIDNSQSMMASEDSTLVKKLPQILAENLPEEIDKRFYELTGKNWDWNTSKFDAKRSNLYQSLKSIELTSKTNPIDGVIFISDGIYNAGISPAYSQINLPIFTIGTGDTTSVDDIQIAELRTNTIAYQGNKVPVEVYIKVPEHWKKKLNISLYEGKNLLETKQTEGDQRGLVKFQLEAKSAGLKRFSVKVDPMPNERNLNNNVREFVLDVIEGKDKILIISSYPHPDIQAIRAALAKSQNYETQVFIPGIHETPTDKPVDVVIWYGAFSASQLLSSIKGDPAHLYIADEKTNLKLLAEKTGIEIIKSGNVADVVRPSYNESFALFKLPDGTEEVLNLWPGVQVPFGSYNLPPRAQVLLYQKIAGLTLEKPLLTFLDIDQKKTALISGTGFWKWRMQENAIQGNNDVFDQLVLKTVQYLSIKNEKRKLIVRPSEIDNTEDIPLSFIIETYNALYERTGNQWVSLQIKNDLDSLFSYQFNSDPFDNKFEIGSLPSGNYTYTATTVDGNESEKTTGNFLVTNRNKELEGLEANHQILKTISGATDGQFFHIANWKSVITAIENLNFKPRISTENKLLPLHRWSVWLILILVLMSTEWVIRRYLGGY